MALIDNKRYFPEIEWRSDSWTHNVFRFFESIFGRKLGIRPELSAWVEDGLTYYAFHTIEAFLAHIEERVRNFQIKIPVRVYIPVLQTPQGFRIPTSPYLFAIAVDNTGTATTSDALTVTITSFTITGSNIGLIASVCDQDDTSSAVTGIVANITAMINIDTQATTGTQGVSLWGLYGASSGNIVATRTGTADRLTLCVTSYTGVSSVTAIGSLVKTKGTGTGTTLAGTLTTPSTNCWTVMGTYVSSGGDTTTAGADTTKRVTGPEIEDQWDSGAAIPTSTSTTLNVNTGGSYNYAYVMAAIVPAAVSSLSPSLSPSKSPSLSPSISPSLSPSTSLSPSVSPSVSPSTSLSPSKSPSLSPSPSPSISPSKSPSLSPSISPSISPSSSLSPSLSPSISPSSSLSPSISPSKSPSVSPSPSPSVSPSPSPAPVINEPKYETTVINQVKP